MAKPLNLLMIEDSENDAELMLEELRRQGFSPIATRVDSAPALEEALAKRVWDLTISDHNMPNLDSAEALRLVKRAAPDLPIIVVSGSVGEEHAVEAMRAGASDFVLKTKLHRLAAVVERELRDAEERLGHRRAAAALVESKQQLRQAQKLEAVGRLAGGIAHDFNNLLTAILGYTDLVLRALPKDNKVRPDVEAIRHAGVRAVDLTRQLSAFSRGQVLNPRVIDLSQVVDTVVRLLSRVIGKDIVIETPHDQALWHVKADPTQIEQIVMNLAVNARDAMPDGGTLTIETANVVVAARNQPMLPPVPGKYVSLQVRDTGEGISPEILAQIFEPFFTTKDLGKGTGLGLATVYGIVQQSGGSIFVASRPGHGAVFTVYLPQTIDVLIPEPVPGIAVRPRGHETILLVEDEASVRQLTARVLQEVGYTVIAADSPSAALHIMSTHTGPLDLLLTDVVMPGMSGPALADRLLASRPGLRVVFMSGYTSESSGAIERLGHTELLVKPFTPAVLIRKIREALQGTAGT